MPAGPERIRDTSPMTDELDEWSVTAKDSNGNVLKDGDAVVLIKDLKVKGANTTIKRGAVYKNIRLTAAGGCPQAPPRRAARSLPARG